MRISSKGATVIPEDVFAAFDAGWRERAPERLRGLWSTLHLFVLRVLLLRPAPLAFAAVRTCAESLGLSRVPAWAQAWNLLQVWPEYQQRLLEVDSRAAVVDSVEAAERGAADALMWWTQFQERPGDRGPKFGAHVLGNGLALLVDAAVRSGMTSGAASARVVYKLATTARAAGVPLDDPAILAELCSALVELVPVADRWTADERREALGILLHGFASTGGLRPDGVVPDDPSYLRLGELIRMSGEGGAR